MNDTKNSFHFSKDIKFKYSWRKYQQRVLDELAVHLDDNHLHIVAPPGSGKTILGLEVMLRLNKPTLIFAPTLSIKNQWIEKFCELFLQVKNKPDWISDDIRNPQFITVLTYQGLHASLSKDTASKTLKTLKNLNFGTIVLDEAHHLKNAWWKALIELKKVIKPTTIGLTATPPYDVSFLEWSRYEELNGPVDSIISVPELIQEENLCPHQDCVYISLPTDIEKGDINKSKLKIKKLFSDIQEDLDFILAIEEFPAYNNPTFHLKWIYSNLDIFISVLVFLKSIGLKLDEAHFEVLGDKNIKIPKLDYYWLEILLTFYLEKDSVYFTNEEHKEKLLNKLKRNGVIEKTSINFNKNHLVNKSLSSSLGKLNSIKEIVDFEYSNLKSELRLVILSDYIRKEYISEKHYNYLEILKLGVIPIFENLRRENAQDIKLGVLTGSIIIIPKSSLLVLEEILKEKNIEGVHSKELPYDADYVLINSTEKTKNYIVYVVTELFQNGEIEVLVGTKSLLGEGWDAPAINTLILASFVGSYVLSNQMRGRAIRTEAFNKNKTSNIWHLVCADPSSEDGGHDLNILKRRFKAFIGASNQGIENGIKRLGIKENISNKEDVDLINQKMFSLALDRESLASKWSHSIKKGNRLIEEYKIPFQREKHLEDLDYDETKSLYFRKTSQYALTAFGFGVASFGFESLIIKLALSISTNNLLSFGINVFGFIGIVGFGYKAFKASRVYLKYRDISKDFEQISKALLESLIFSEAIKTNASKLKIVTEFDNTGSIYCHLVGGTNFEKTLFLDSLDEILKPIENPKYLIIRKSKFKNLYTQKDYHSVPDVLAKKAKYAKHFAKKWTEYVGNSEMIYTRNLEGRKLLLKAKLKSLSAVLDDEKKAEKIQRWR